MLNFIYALINSNIRNKKRDTFEGVFLNGYTKTSEARSEGIDE